MKSQPKLLILLSVCAVLLTGLIRLNLASAESVKGSNLKFNPKKDTVYTPKTETIKDTLTLAGSVATDQIAALRFKNSGKLVWVGVKVGDKVKRGQAIASLDRSELRKNLATQFNNYRTSLSQFNDVQDQYQSTKDNLLVTDAVQRLLDRTQYSLDNSVINYELTDMAIAEATLVSPISGVVTAIDQPFSGTNITPATATFTIINPEAIYFKSEIDQEAVTKIKVGQPATLRLDSFPEKNIDSKITYVAFTPVSGQTSTVYEVRLELPLKNADLTYRLGMDGDTSIDLATADNALTVPIDAVYDDNGQKYVYLKKDNALVRQNVEVGIENDDSAQITSGLSSNDSIVIVQK